jgi:hypothetical protein
MLYWRAARLCTQPKPFRPRRIVRPADATLKAGRLAPDQPPGGDVGLCVTAITRLQASWLLEQSFVSAEYGRSCRHERGACCRGAHPYPARPGRRVIVVTDLASLRGPSRGTVELPLRLYWSGPSPVFDPG